MFGRLLESLQDKIHTQKIRCQHCSSQLNESKDLPCKDLFFVVEKDEKENCLIGSIYNVPFPHELSMYCAKSSLGKVVTITNLIALGRSVQL